MPGGKGSQTRRLLRCQAAVGGSTAAAFCRKAWFWAAGMPKTMQFARCLAAGMPKTMQFAWCLAAGMPKTTVFAWFLAIEVPKTMFFLEGTTER